MGQEEFEVHVTKVERGEVANRLSGFILLGDERLSFGAIAYGRYGGQNVSPDFGRESKMRLKELGIDAEEFKALLQRKLVEGDFTVEPKPSKKVKRLRTSLKLWGRK